MKKAHLIIITVLIAVGTVFIVKGYNQDKNAEPKFAVSKKVVQDNSGSSRNCPCCSSKNANGSNDKISDTKEMVFKYYAQKYGDRNISIDIKDYGCHMEAVVMKGSKIIKKFSISGNQIDEIS